MDYTYIDSFTELEKTCRALKGEPVLGVDLECENNLHYCGTYISIIQISSRSGNYVIDVLSIEDVDPLIPVLEDPGIVKVFHDAVFDLMILAYQLDCRPVNIYDTRIASLFLGRAGTGLRHLLKDFFDVDKENGFQMRDWTVRPLPKEMLEYAVSDVKYLPALMDILSDRLRQLGRLSWVMEEFRALESDNLCFREKSFKDFPGYSMFSDTQRSVLKYLFDLRRKVAEEVDKPPYFIINTRRLAELVRNPPKGVEEWKTVRGVHPIVRSKAVLFHEAVQEGLKGNIPLEPVKKIYYTPEQAERVRRISEIREQLACKLNLPKHMLLSKEQMQDYALTGSLRSLRRWQKDLFKNLLEG